MTLFRNKYRIESARLQHWNYANAGAYFITICTKDRAHYFGKIENDKIQLSEIGKIVESEWLKTPEIRPDMNLQLGEFVVMPNHFHGIIIIGENKFNTTVETQCNASENDDKHTSPIETQCIASLPQTTESTNQFAPQRKNVSSIIRGFKSAVTQFVKINSIDFAWQSRFHDHIIRNHKEFVRIENYIFNNTQNWKNDTFYKS